MVPYCKLGHIFKKYIISYQWIQLRLNQQLNNKLFCPVCITIIISPNKSWLNRYCLFERYSKLHSVLIANILITFIVRLMRCYNLSIDNSHGHFNLYVLYNLFPCYVYTYIVVTSKSTCCFLLIGKLFPTSVNYTITISTVWPIVVFVLAIK